MKRLLFVCGTPRSGTTALAALLNASPHVVLGIERFAGLLMLYGRAQPDAVRVRIRALFERDRLLGDRLPHDTKPYPPAEREAAMAKWDRATYVGDKAPHLYKHIGTLAAACPESRFVYILRNPFNVAALWQRRADDEQDSWPAKDDHEAAIEAWNESLQFALDALDALEATTGSWRFVTKAVLPSVSDAAVPCDHGLAWFRCGTVRVSLHAVNGGRIGQKDRRSTTDSRPHSTPCQRDRRLPPLPGTHRADTTA